MWVIIIPWCLYTYEYVFIYLFGNYNILTILNMCVCERQQTLEYYMNLISRLFAASCQLFMTDQNYLYGYYQKICVLWLAVLTTCFLREKLFWWNFVLGNMIIVKEYHLWLIGKKYRWVGKLILILFKFIRFSTKNIWYQKCASHFS